MSQEAHVSLERLTSWALAPTAPDDRATAAHLASCQECVHRLSHLTTELDGLRDEAWADADRHFDEAALRHQRSRVLDRIAHVGQSARVLAFPGHPHSGVVPRAAGSRGWISVAAAAGLIIGIVAGQSWHLLPFDRARHIVAEPTQAAWAGRGPFVRVAVSSLTEDELLDEIDISLQQGRRAVELRALEALTPTMNENR